MAQKLYTKLKYSVTSKTVIGTIVILLIFQACSMLIGNYFFTESITERYIESAYATADTCVTTIDGDHVAEYLTNDEYAQEYEEIAEKLQTLADTQDVTYISVIILDETYTNMVYVFSIEGVNYDYPLYDPGYEREATNEDYIEAYEKVYTEQSRETVVRGSESTTGAHITVHVPVLDSAGNVSAILYVQKQMSNLESAGIKYRVNIACVTVLLIAISVITIVLLMRRQLINPILRLNEETERFAREHTVNKDELEKLTKTKDEVALISEGIYRMEREIVTSQAELIEITGEKERIGAELDIARQIQADMLPSVFPPFPEIGALDIYAVMTPAREVGGDYYDYYMLDNDHMAIIMADVSGKGIPAALFMVTTKTLIKDRALMGGRPSEILKYVNERITGSNAMEMFVTVWCGILTVSTGEIIAANAGHEYPVIRRGNGKYELFKDKHSFVVAGLEDVVYSDYTFTLEKGGGLFLYTDGIPEANNEKGEMLGTAAMMDILNSYTGKEPEAVLKHVSLELEKFVGKAEPFDDTTMLFLEYRGTQDNIETE